jgi:streptomycin 6-kinase
LRDRRGDLAADPAPVRRIRRRLDALSADLGLDRERIRRWAVAHALAWGLADDEWFPASWRARSGSTARDADV